MATDLAQEIRAAIIASNSVTSELSAWLGSYPVHTRRPLPADTPYPCIAVSPDVSNIDTLERVSDQTPEIVRDIAVYGKQDESSDYRKVERIAYAIRDLFHRKRQSVTVSGYTVREVIASGPIPGPADADDIVARIVTVTFDLVKN